MKNSSVARLKNSIKLLSSLINSIDCVDEYSRDSDTLSSQLAIVGESKSLTCDTLIQFSSEKMNSAINIDAIGKDNNSEDEDISFGLQGTTASNNSRFSESLQTAIKVGHFRIEMLCLHCMHRHALPILVNPLRREKVSLP